MSRNPDAVIGIVIEERPNKLFLFRLDDGRELLGYLSGKFKQHNIRVLIGDKVEVILDPYGGKGTNRIVWRV